MIQTEESYKNAIQNALSVEARNVWCKLWWLSTWLITWPVRYVMGHIAGPSDFIAFFTKSTRYHFAESIIDPTTSSPAHEVMPKSREFAHFDCTLGMSSPVDVKGKHLNYARKFSWHWKWTQRYEKFRWHQFPSMSLRRRKKRHSRQRYKYVQISRHYCLLMTCIPIGQRRTSKIVN